MDTENKDVTERNEFSLPTSLEVDDIIEFYKDKDSDTDNAENQEIQEPQPSIYLNKIRNLFKKTNANKPDEDVTTKVYGLSDKGRIYLYRGISLAVSVCIIAGAFILAYFLPGNEAVINERKAELRAEKEYTGLKSRHAALKKEVTELRKSNAEKKEKVEKISDFDNTKAELSAKITAKRYELTELNTQISEKRAKISELDLQIAEKSPPESILPPGRYVIGKNIAAGKYMLTGTGKFMVATPSGKSKVNTTLGSTPLEITLDSGDIVKFDSKVKFTSAN